MHANSLSLIASHSPEYHARDSPSIFDKFDIGSASASKQAASKRSNCLLCFQILWLGRVLMTVWTSLRKSGKAIKYMVSTNTTRAIVTMIGQGISFIIDP